MRLYRRGDSGGEVRDIQKRLVSAGFLKPSSPEIASSTFGEETESAVRSFQENRRLVVDGIVGPDTWRALVEASRRLGSRFLFLREPPFRGDDVAELKRRLNNLGFYCGKEDGIFDVNTAMAVEQFQRNFGIPPDGIVGKSTVEAILRISRIATDSPFAVIREIEKGLPRGGIKGRRIMIDPGHGFPPDPGEVGPSGLRESDVVERIAEIAGSLLERKKAIVLYSRRPGENLTQTERARRANQSKVDLVVSVHLCASEDETEDGALCFYYQRGNYRSPYGFRLANHILEELKSKRFHENLSAEGKAVPLLRDTRMPVVVVFPGYITNPAREQLLRSDPHLSTLAEAIATAAERYFLGHKSRAEASEEAEEEKP